MGDTKIKSRDDWSFNTIPIEYEFKKENLIRRYVNAILIKTQKIFKYNNLPDTIPQKDFELLLQVNGCATIVKTPKGIYAMRGGLGGVPNAYYLPTMSVVANPYLNFNKTLEIDKDCVVILNDSLYQGLMPIINENAYLLAECDISFKFATINSRVNALITAPDDTIAHATKNFFKQIENGEELDIVVDDDFQKSIQSYQMSGGKDSIQSLIELKQYIMGTFYNELGIQSQFNMKREAINSSESTLNEDILYPLIDDMLEQRQIGLEKVNAMFGTNITVELSSVWKQLREQAKLDMQIKENEADPETKEDDGGKENETKEDI